MTWFWALTSWEFILAKRTFHQVLPIYGVPRDPPPHGLSCKTIVLGNLAYAMSSFNACVDTNGDYTTWFVKSSTRPTLGMSL